MSHLAQLNIAKLLKPIDHPQIAEFVDNLDRINALAESSKGFVWRLKDDDNNATSIQAFDDPMYIVNMSVWESVESLKDFVYRSGHMEIMRKRSNWFERPKDHTMVLWWVPEGHMPSLEEAKSKLEFLNKHGESPNAFTFRIIFSQAS